MNAAAETTSRDLKLPKGVNLNTVIMVALGALLWYLSGIFVTQKQYDKDQNRTESTLARIEAKLDAMYQNKRTP